ncbi:hypothetical protein [Streptomyces sp. NPDC003006]
MGLAFRGHLVRLGGLAEAADRVAGIGGFARSDALAEAAGRAAGLGGFA